MDPLVVEVGLPSQSSSPMRLNYTIYNPNDTCYIYSYDIDDTDYNWNVRKKEDGSELERQDIEEVEGLEDTDPSVWVKIGSKQRISREQDMGYFYETPSNGTKVLVELKKDEVYYISEEEYEALVEKKPPRNDMVYKKIYVKKVPFELTIRT